MHYLFSTVLSLRHRHFPCFVTSGSRIDHPEAAEAKHPRKSSKSVMSVGFR